MNFLELKTKWPYTRLSSIETYDFVQVTGEVFDSRGSIQYRIEAVWDKYANLYKIDADEKIEHEEVIWRINPSL